MKVTLKCFSKLVDPDSCNYRKSTTYELDDGQTLQDLVDRAGVASEEVKIAFANSRKVDLDTVLSDNDRAGLAPADGGKQGPLVNSLICGPINKKKVNLPCDFDFELISERWSIGVLE